LVPDIANNEYLAGLGVDGKIEVKIGRNAAVGVFDNVCCAHKLLIKKRLSTKRDRILFIKSKI